MKYTIFILALFLFATNGFWLYLAADQATVHKYRQQELYEAKHRIAVLEKACSRLFSGMAKDDASQLLGELTQGDESFEKEGRLNTTWLSLELDESGRVLACQ